MPQLEQVGAGDQRWWVQRRQPSRVGNQRTYEPIDASHHSLGGRHERRMRVIRPRRGASFCHNVERKRVAHERALLVRPVAILGHVHFEVSRRGGRSVRPPIGILRAGRAREHFDIHHVGRAQRRVVRLIEIDADTIRVANARERNVELTMGEARLRIDYKAMPSQVGLHTGEKYRDPVERLTLRFINCCAQRAGENEHRRAVW